MNAGFWGKLKKPIIAIAPMANVTDAAFRKMFIECTPPDVFWTEFVSVEALLSRGKKAVLPDLWFDKLEHPIVAQIFGAKPEQFETVGKMLREMGFDGVDVNMGCPDKSVEKQGAGAALIKNPELAKQIIRALKKGANPLPVSVKTRIGYAKNEISTWIPSLLKENLAAIIVHLRTRKEMSNAPAHWELTEEILKLRDRYVPDTLILGNGDVNSLDEARARVKASGIDGVMIGRGIFGNPWFFSGKTPDLTERLERMVRHVKTFEKMFANIKRFEVMKKHFKAYVHGFLGARELLTQLMETKTAAEVKKLVKAFLTKNTP
jgi:nifR3 family TIM-barrel protein